MNKREFIVGLVIGFFFVAMYVAIRNAHYSNCVHTMIGDQPVVICQ